MTIFTIILSAFITSHFFHQDVESKICDCLEKNFKQAGLDHGQILNEIEIDLIRIGIIDSTFESRKNQLINVAKNGIIGKPRNYENVKFEQLGLKSLKYCTELAVYAGENDSPPPIYNLFKELENISFKDQEKIDLMSIRKDIAKILLDYADEFDENSKLWKTIELTYLYHFSEHIDFFDLPVLPPFEELEQETSQTAQFHIGGKDKILFEGNSIQFSQLCDLVQKSLVEKKSIFFTNEKTTQFNFYLGVYNEVKLCADSFRDEYCMKKFQKKYIELTKEQRKMIDEDMPIIIKESQLK